MANDTHTYFISYSRADSEAVLKLATELRAAGADLWLDQLDIVGGQHWDTEVESALTRCDGVLCVLSPEAVASKNVMDEVSYALDKNKLIVPTLLRACDIPFRLRRVQHIDFTGDEERALNQLKRALGIDRVPRSAADDAADTRAIETDTRVPEKAAAEPSGSKSSKARWIAVAAVVLILGIGLAVYQPWKTGTATTVAVASKTLEPGDTFRDCDVCPEMVVVPEGSFVMGSPDSDRDAADPEKPQHPVKIARPFAVGVYEVTFAEWDACVDGGGCNGYRPKDQGWGRSRRPVINVNWNDAGAYVQWLSSRTGKDYRLLTEAEWEYVARAGTTTRYSFGDTITDKDANFNGNVGKTTEVGSYPANPWGLHDMHGNVWEWVADCYDEEAYNTHKNYPAMVGSWHESCDRVLRGGSWDFIPRILRSAIRYWYFPDNRFNFVGFRVARTL